MLLLSLFCLVVEVEVVCVEMQGVLQVFGEFLVEVLVVFDVVIKLFGISFYQLIVLVVVEQGIIFIGGIVLWFVEYVVDDGIVYDIVCVIGIKGKSIIIVLVVYLLWVVGYCIGLVGNIGLLLLEVLDLQLVFEYWVVELFSYQIGEVVCSGVCLQVVVVLNLFLEYLDWYGSEQCYIEDKLWLVMEVVLCIVVFNVVDLYLVVLLLFESEVVWFNQLQGWYMCGDVVYRGEQVVFDICNMLLLGCYNRGNLCVVLVVLEVLGFDVVVLVLVVQEFCLLLNCLQWIGLVDGLIYINDLISIMLYVSLVVLECFVGQCIVLLVGGYDCGLDWSDFMQYMVYDVLLVEIVIMGSNGLCIYMMLQLLVDVGCFGLYVVVDLFEVMVLVCMVLGVQGGVVLLLLGVLSFGVYCDYVVCGCYFV